MDEQKQEKASSSQRDNLKSEAAIIPSELSYLIDNQMVDQFGYIDKLGSCVADAVSHFIETYHCESDSISSSILVLAGPGNNGADAYMTACSLRKLGFSNIIVFVFDKANNPNSEKALGLVKSLSIPIAFKFDKSLLEWADVIIDGVFGIGCRVPLPFDISDIFRHINESNKSIIAIDIPSGMCADSGKIDRNALRCNATITCNYRKIAHVVMPAAGCIGNLQVCDIGIKIPEIHSSWVGVENTPEIWKSKIRTPQYDSDKYSMGHVIVIAGEMHGAAKLAVNAAVNSGIGMVTLLMQHRSHLQYFNDICDSIICDDIRNLDHIINNKSVTSIVVGMGYRQSKSLAALIHNTISKFPKIKYIIDAGAILSLAQYNKLNCLNANCIITPHKGEFRSIMQLYSLNEADSNAAVRIAKVLNTCVLLKGYNTVVSNGSLTSISTNSTPRLAQAGTGDVLAGIIGGIAGRCPEMNTFESASAGVWIHNSAAKMGSFIPSNLASRIQNFI